MKNLLISTWVENVKMFRSRIFWITVVSFSAIPILGGLYMFVLTNPENVGNNGWKEYFGFLSQAMAVGGILLYGFVTSWAFGREYSDRTIKDLLAIPISRTNIVLSKFLVVFIWCTILTFDEFVLGLITGAIINIPGWTQSSAISGFYTLAICSILTIIISSPVAFFASYGRGYLPPLGYVVFTVVLAQIIGGTALGPYCPWTLAALYSGISGTSDIHLFSASYVIFAFTSVLGIVGTFSWWCFADQA